MFKIFVYSEQKKPYLQYVCIVGMLMYVINNECAFENKMLNQLHVLYWLTYFYEAEFIQKLPQKKSSCCGFQLDI